MPLNYDKIKRMKIYFNNHFIDMTESKYRGSARQSPPPLLIFVFPSSPTINTILANKDILKLPEIMYTLQEDMFRCDLFTIVWLSWIHAKKISETRTVKPGQKCSNQTNYGLHVCICVLVVISVQRWSWEVVQGCRWNSTSRIMAWPIDLERIAGCCWPLERDRVGEKGK